MVKRIVCVAKILPGVIIFAGPYSGLIVITGLVILAIFRVHCIFNLSLLSILAKSFGNIHPFLYEIAHFGYAIHLRMSKKLV